jgi:CxxC-x17-CxxC domain-containing protein
MGFLDRLLTCADCGGEFIFTAGEQLFFFDKQFKNDPKRCKPCKSKRAAGLSRTETRTECSACSIETTVPFKPTQGRPVLCRQCFQSNRTPTTGALVTAAATAEMVAGTGAEHTGVGAELLVAAEAPQA